MSPIIEKESNEEAENPHVDVPTKQRFLWGLGGFADASITYGAASNVSYIYINAMGFLPALVTMATAVPRLFDALSDPFVGHLSDNTRSRWGRRRPWMFFGLIISAILGVMIWHPPAAPKEIWNWGLFAYIAIMMSMIYAVGYTFFNVPHIAMGYELSTDYNERTHLFKWRQFSFAAAGFLTPWFLWLCSKIQGPNAEMFKGSEGVITVSIIAGAVILLTGLPSVFFCKEKFAIRTEADKVPFLSAVKMTLDNKPFWLLVVSNFIAKFCMAITGIFFVFIFSHHIGRGDQQTGLKFLAIFFNGINIACFLAMAPVAMLTERIGKKPALVLMLLMSTVAYLSLWFTFSNSETSYLTMDLPVVGSLSLHWTSLITAVLIGAFTNTMPMINNSMLADVCDLDELKSGHRREAFYGAVFTTMDKIALGVALGLQGFLLAYSGFDAKLDQQTPETVRFWLLALVITQPVGFLVGITAVLFYPLTRGRCHDIRKELDARSAAKRRAAAQSKPES